MRFNDSRELQWRRELEVAGVDIDTPRVATGARGDVYVSATVGESVWAWKLSRSSGEVAWTKRLTSSWSVSALDMHAHEQGIVVVGSYRERLDAGEAVTQDDSDGVAGFIAVLEEDDGRTARLHLVDGSRDDQVTSVGVADKTLLVACHSASSAISVGDAEFLREGPGDWGVIVEMELDGHVLTSMRFAIPVLSPVFDFALTSKGIVAVGSLHGELSMGNAALTAGAAGAGVVMLLAPL